MSAEPTTPRSSEGLDRIGAFASGLCAVHCGVVALLPASLGVLGLGVLVGPEAEWVFTLTAVAFAGAAMALGWRKHRSVGVAIVLTLGIAALLASRGLEMGGGHEHGHEEAAAAHHDETTEGHDHGDESHHEGADPWHAVGTAVGVLGGLLLIGGHVLNLRASRRASRSCH